MRIFRTIIAFIITILLLFFVLFLTNQTSLKLLDLAWYVSIVSTSLLIIFCISAILIKYKTDALISDLKKGIDDFVSIIKNKDKKILPNNNKQLSTLGNALRALLALFLVSSSAFILVAILTNMILISNLWMSVEYKDQLVRQNELASEATNIDKEYNIIEYANRIDLINQKIKSQYETYSLLNQIKYGWRHNEHNSTTYDILVIHNDKFYSTNANFRALGGASPINTCEISDKYCDEQALDLLSKFRYMKDNTTINDLNPYIASLFLDIKSKREVLNGFKNANIDITNDNHIMAFIRDMASQCGYHGELFYSQHSSYLKLIDLSSSFKIYFSKLQSGLTSTPFKLNRNAYVINNITTNDLNKMTEFIETLLYFGNVIYIDDKYKPKTIDYASNNAEEFTVADLLSNYYTQEHHIKKSFDQISNSCADDISNLKSLKRYIESKLKSFIKKQK